MKKYIINYFLIKNETAYFRVLEPFLRELSIFFLMSFIIVFVFNDSLNILNPILRENVALEFFLYAYIFFTLLGYINKNVRKLIFLPHLDNIEIYLVFKPVFFLFEGFFIFANFIVFVIYKILHLIFKFGTKYFVNLYKNKIPKLNICLTVINLILLHSLNTNCKFYFILEQVPIKIIFFCILLCFFILFIFFYS
jgi:hypothetical protein